MNLLIVADKSNIKTYRTVMESAPNTSVLGAVTRLTTDFITVLRDKYNPHVVVIDTAVPTKNTDTKIIIQEISRAYPYMKILVLTDENDVFEYPAYSTIRGQISNLEIKELLGSLSKDTDYRVSTAKRTDNTDYEGSAPTEKLSDKIYSDTFKPKVDNLSIPNPRTLKTHRKPSSGFRFNALLIVASAVIIILIVVIVVLVGMLGDRSNGVATPDEATTYLAETIETEGLPTEETTADAQTWSELLPTVSSDVEIVSEEETIHTEVTTEKPTAKSNSGNKSNNGNKNNRLPQNEQSSSSNSNNSSNSNTKPNSSSQNNVTSTQVVPGDVYVSYNDDTYHNSKSNEVTDVKLSYSSKTMYVDDTLQLTATVSPSTANQTITWSTSDSRIVSVSNGYISAKGVGTATITAKANNGKSGSCKVTVIENPKSNDVHLSAEQYNISVGDTITITLIGSNYCTWSVSNSAPITINRKSGNSVTVYAKKSGTTQIIFKDGNTDKKYTCNISVK